MSSATITINFKNFIRRTVSRFCSEERGQGMVEMALVLMFMLPLTFGMIDAGRAIYTASVVRAAAQEGARAGIIDQSDIMEAIESKMIGLDLENASVAVDTGNEDIIEIDITYEFTFVTPMVEAFFGTLDLTGTASMIIQ